MITPDRFIGRNLLSEETRRTAERVEERLLVASTGLHIVFESRSINGPTANECTSFHVARSTFERNGPENGTTQEILEYLQAADWTFFIWIPENVVRGDWRTFAMKYAHELAHHRQALDPSGLVKPTAFLRSWKRHHSPQTEAERRPDELDAHRVALQEFENIFGQDGLESFIDDQSPRTKQFFVRLKGLLQEYEAYCRQEETRGIQDS